MGKEQLPTISRRRFIKGLFVASVSPQEVLKGSLKYYSKENHPPTSTEEVIHEPEPTPEEKIIFYKREFQEMVMPNLLENQELVAQLQLGGHFNNVLKTLEDYHPIYRTAQDAYNVSWFCLPVHHGPESSFSTNEHAFQPGRLHYGAVQRAIDIHPNSQVEEASKGFEYLATLPQNHSDDWRELLWCAWKLARDARKSQEIDPTKPWYWAVEDAFYSFLGNGNGKEAERRIQRVKTLRDIFG